MKKYKTDQSTRETKVLRLSEETIAQLEQFYDMWLRHSDTAEEKEEMKLLYEELCRLIEGGNPYKEYEVEEYQNTYLVKICGDTLGIAFFEE